MSQLQHARALNIMDDAGIDPDTARYVLKRLYDMGMTFRAPDPDPVGASPPTARGAPRIDRAQLIAGARAQIQQAAAEKKAAEEAAAERVRAEEAAAAAQRQRELAVQRVLIDL